MAFWLLGQNNYRIGSWNENYVMTWTLKKLWNYVSYSPDCLFPWSGPETLIRPCGILHLCTSRGISKSGLHCWSLTISAYWLVPLRVMLYGKLFPFYSVFLTLLQNTKSLSKHTSAAWILDALHTRICQHWCIASIVNVSYIHGQTVSWTLYARTLSEDYMENDLHKTI
jgi:hypothetical protein